MIGWPGCGGGGHPGIRVASRMACINSETSSGLFCVYKEHSGIVVLFEVV